jgi:hypothetical protein
MNMSEGSKKQSVIQGGNHASAGLLERAVISSADFAEKAVTTAFDVARDVSTEVNGRTLETLAWVEALPRAAFKIARETSERVHRLTHEGLNASEGIALHAICTIRATGQGAAELASRTTASFIATPADRVADAA